MAKPQPTYAHIRIPHQIGEHIMVSQFTARQRRILDLILRLSWGCGKEEAQIPRQRDFGVVGVGEGHIKTELERLVRDNIIRRDCDRYALNRDLTQWRVSRFRGYHREELTGLVGLNLNQSGNRFRRWEGGTYRGRKPKPTEVGSPSDTTSATPKEKNNKQNNKQNIDTCILVFDHWNKQNIIVHKKVTDDVRSVIVRTLRSYSVEEVNSAISNYAEIVQGQEYFFNYRWTLRDFLKRGIEKFMDLEVCKSNYREAGIGKTRHSRDLPKVYTPSPDYDDL